MGFREYGMVGCGPWGLRLLDLSRKTLGAGVIGAVADLRPEALAAARQIDDGLFASTDPQTLLQRPGLRGVLIATPTPTHGDLVEAALSQGLDVYVEKVAAMDPVQADQIEVRRAQRSARLHLGLPWQHGPVADALCHCLREEQLGAIRSVKSTRVGPVAVHRSEGVIWDLLPHDVAMLLSVLPGLPRAVRARDLGWAPHGGPLLAVTLDLDHARAQSLSLRASWIDPAPIRRWEITGEHGHVVIEEIDHRRTLRLDDRAIAADTDEPLKAVLRAFVGEAPGNLGSRVVPQEALTKVLTAAAEAARSSGRWVPIGSPLRSEVPRSDSAAA